MDTNTLEIKKDKRRWFFNSLLMLVTFLLFASPIVTRFGYLGESSYHFYSRYDYTNWFSDMDTTFDAVLIIFVNILYYSRWLNIIFCATVLGLSIFSKGETFSEKAKSIRIMTLVAYITSALFAFTIIFLCLILGRVSENTIGWNIELNLIASFPMYIILALSVLGILNYFKENPIKRFFNKLSLFDVYLLASTSLIFIDLTSSNFKATNVDGDVARFSANSNLTMLIENSADADRLGGLILYILALVLISIAAFATIVYFILKNKSAMYAKITKIAMPILVAALYFINAIYLLVRSIDMDDYIVWNSFMFNIIAATSIYFIVRMIMKKKY